MALCAFNFAQAQSYTQPYQTVPTLKHASSQSLYSVNVSIDGNTVMSYTDTMVDNHITGCKTNIHLLQKKDKKLHLMFVLVFGHGI